MNKFWVVWNPIFKVPSIKHLSENLARIEAERLARQNPDQEFIVLEAIGRCRKNDIIWESADTYPETEDVPF